MEASHFRKGNIVANESLDIFKKGYVEMEARWIYEIAVKDSGQSYNPYVDNFKPIPLTEDWLLRFGLKERYVKGEWSWANCKSGTGQWGSSTEIRNTKSSKATTGYVYNSDYPEILYVHQLQNLYYALTAEELTLKTE